MSVTERLAREIFWMGFYWPKNVGKSKAACWRDLPAGTREVYLKEAGRLIRTVRSLPMALVDEIR